MLAEGADPAWRVAARETGEYAAAGEVVEHGDVLGKLDRIDGGEVHAKLADAHRLGVLRDEVVPEEGVGRRLDALDLEVLLGHAEAGVTELLGELHLIAHAAHQTLEANVLGAGQRHTLPA